MSGRRTYPEAPAFMLAPRQVMRVEGPVVGPKVFVVPKMAELNGEVSRIPPKSNLPRIITEADFQWIGSWSVDHMREFYPNLQVEALLQHIFQLLNDRNYRMLRTDNAWGVAFAFTTFYENRTQVASKWVLSQKPTTGEALAIYEAFDKWAQEIKAYRLTIGSTTGVDIGPFAKRMKGFAPRHVAYVKDYP